MRSTLVRVAALFFFFATGVAGAEEGDLRGLYFTGGDRTAPAPLLGSTVEVKVTGIIARARVAQVFANPSPQWVEGVYIFPLPEDAAVDALLLTVGDRTVRGVIREKGEARQTYEAATQQGRKASLLEQQRPDVFTISVSNIGPGETVEIVIELQQIVRWEQGKFRLRFPMVVAERFSAPHTKTPAQPEERPVLAPPISRAPVNPFALHVDLAPGFPLAHLESPTHRVDVKKGRDSRYAVDLADGVAPADADFILEWTPAFGREPRAVVYSEEVDGEHYALLMVMPPDASAAAAARLPRETIFVIDNSYSMQGQSIEQARQALLLGLGRLQAGDWFNVIVFHDTTIPLFPAPVPADAGHLATARRHVQQLGLGSGTVMLPALRAAFHQQGPPGLVRQVIFITDGQVNNEAELSRYIADDLGDRRLFMVGIGSAPNASFMRKAAEFGRGTFTQIGDTSRVAERMGSLFSQLEAPVLQDLEVRWDDPAAEMLPPRTPDLYLGQPLIVTARRAGAAAGVSVSGRRNGESWEDSFPAAAEVQGAGLDKLWARQKIESLLDTLRLQSGGDPQQVQQEVTALGLRHHLVTPYTSLVAVDVTPTAPAGIAPVQRFVAVNRPRGSVMPDPGLSAGSAIEECITVTAESPLLDERRISVGATVVDADRAGIPGANDPWRVLQSTPGVLTDRINVGGNESGQPARLAGPGAGGDQAVWSLDGAILTDMSALAPSPSFLDFDAFEEMQVTTGGADATLETPGTHVHLAKSQGTNEWRGSGRLLWGGDDLGSGEDRERDRLADLRAGSLESGGPLRHDRLWIWGSLHRGDVDRIALGGQPEESRLKGGSLKLNLQPAASNSAFLLWNRNDVSGSGFGASPYRAPETTWSRDGKQEVWKIEDTQILGSRLYVVGSLSGADHTLRDLPLGPGGGAAIDPAGVLRGSWFALQDAARTRAVDVRANGFSEAGPSSHELRMGLGGREHDSRSILAPPGRVEIAGSTLGLAGVDVVEIWRRGQVAAVTKVAGAWTEDLVTRGPATFVLGLRYDEQDLGIPGHARARTLSPRLGLTYRLGADGDTLLRASLSRFAARLGAEPAFRLGPETPSASYFLARGESLQSWHSVNFDPLAGGNPNTVDPDLAPEITDELALGVERSLRPEFVIGLQAIWRRTEDLLEERWLVRDTDGRVFVATAEDWVPAGALAGVLPDGTPYGVPFFDLRPGLSWTGGTLLTNGDRRQDYLGLTLSWQKRLAQRWSSRGHVTWSDWEWRVGPGFRRHDDPTRALGGGDGDGDPVAEPAAALDRPYPVDRFIAGRWAFHWHGLVQLPREVSASLAVDGREGYPLAWYRQVARERAGIARVQLTERLDASRADDVVTVDGRLEKELWIGDLGLTVGLDVSNLLDEETTLWRETDLGFRRAGAADQTVAPRTLRLGAKVSWR